ncbi:MAG: DUF192 domain-containing protein, partial [Rhodothermales bacterium]
MSTDLRTGMLVLAFALALVGCGSNDSDLPTIRTQPEFRKDGTLSFIGADGDTLSTLDIEIAETEQARLTGLMGRSGLPPQSGMLFIMDDVDARGFWMKNTPLPLDIIFVGPDSQVINIVKRTTPFSVEEILPTAPKKYVVEVRAGVSDRLGITDSTR